MYRLAQSDILVMIKQESDSERMEQCHSIFTGMKILAQGDEWYKIVVTELGKLSKLKSW